MLNNLPEDILFHQIQPFIGNEHEIYFNKYVKEFRVKFSKKNTIYKSLNALFDNISIIYNKQGGGSVIEIGSFEDKNVLCLQSKNKFAITHIAYKHKNTLIVYTELCKRIEYYDPYDDYDPEDWIFSHIPHIKYSTWYNHSSNIK
jgi:hypothetical protein